MKVALVASNGGHLSHLMWLRPWWEQLDRFWVSFDTPDARSRLDGEQVHWAWHPTNRHLGNLVRNTGLAGAVLGRELPDLLLTSGAGVAVPFVWTARALGIPTVFLEVYDRVDTPTWTGRAIAPVVDRILVQWEEQRAMYPGGVLVGRPR